MKQRGSWRRWRVWHVLNYSTWVTAVWNWFTTLLLKFCEPVLWSTMVFSCYTLAPGARKPPADITSLAFVAQFTALDIGGIGMYKLAQRLGPEQGKGVKRMGHTLIGITLFTVTYAGVSRMISFPGTVTNSVEIALVIVRSIMTVLYSKTIQTAEGEQNVSQLPKQTVTVEPEEHKPAPPRMISPEAATQSPRDDITITGGSANILIARDAIRTDVWADESIARINLVPTDQEDAASIVAANQKESGQQESGQPTEDVASKIVASGQKERGQMDTEPLTRGQFVSGQFASGQPTTDVASSLEPVAKRTRAETRKLIKMAIQLDRTRSDREIANDLKCSHTTVGKVRDEMIAKGWPVAEN